MFEILTGIVLFIPVVLILTAVVSIVKAVVGMRRLTALNQSGERTTGRVMGSHVTYRKSRTSMVESIEFTTREGRVVRGLPWIPDNEMVDREGSEVAVIYDASRPDHFIAPMNGDRVKARRFATEIIASLVAIAFFSFLIYIALTIIPN